MTKIQNILAVGAIAASAFVHQASAQNTVRQFKDELADKLGNKKNKAAAQVIARTIKKYSRRDSKRVVAFARLGNKSLEKLVRDNLRGNAAVTILRGTARGYFGAARLDRRFAGAVRLIVRRLPNSQKTPAVLKSISDRLIKVNLGKGGSAALDQTIRDLVYNAGGETPPTS